MAKTKALYYIEDGGDLKCWDIPNEQKNYQKRAAVMDDLKEKLLSEQPARKKVKKATVHNCPWREGYLLAYKAVSCPPENYLRNKYLLLRVVEIQRSPVSKIEPDSCYDERMIVAVYGWVGDYIPDADIVKNLEFVPTHINTPLKRIDIKTASLIEQLPENLRSGLKQHLFSNGARYCSDLPYKSDCIDTVEITLLAEEDGFDRRDYEFLKTDLCSIVISGTRSFELSQESIFRKLGIITD